MDSFVKHRYQGCRLLIDRKRLEDSFLRIICSGPGGRPAAFERLNSSVSADAYRFEYGEKPYFYKRFSHRNWKDPLKEILRGTRAQRALRGHLLLNFSGFRTPRVIAAGRQPPCSFLITQYLEGYVGLDRWFIDQASIGSPADFRNEKRRRIKEVAALIRQLHDRRIFHGDLGWGNIMISISSSGNRRYALIDNERTRCCRWRRTVQRIRNLVDLNMTAGTKLSSADRLRFYKAYMSIPPPLAYPSKTWLKTIEHKTVRGLFRKSLKKSRMRSAG